MHTLTKEDGANDLDGVEELILGLGWERKAGIGEGSGIGKAKGWLARKQREAKGETDPADLDALALFFVGNKPTKYLGADNFEPFKDEATAREKQSVSHTGDSVQGDGDGDDEAIKLKLRDVPARFTRILLVVGAFKPGSSITAVKDVKATVYDATGGSPAAVAQIEPSLMEDKDILAIAAVDRVGPDRWTLSVVDESFNVTKGDIRSLLRNSLHVFG